MGAPKINESEYNGRTSNKKDAGQKNVCPRIKGAPFIRYFRVIIYSTPVDYPSSLTLESAALQTEGALGRNLDPNDLRVTIAYLDIG